MSRLIMFSDYLGKGDKAHMLESIQYIASREGVELNYENKVKNLKSVELNASAANRKQSGKQIELIKELLTKFPDLQETNEYYEMEKNKNMLTSSHFISTAMERLEEMAFSNEHYLKYISERPGIEINPDDCHGLFNQHGDANFEDYYKKLEKHDGIVWRDIISLTREDATDLDFDNQQAWRTLLQEKMNEKSKLLGIPIENFEWCAAFHDEGYHPHVHVMCWDKTAQAGYQTKEAIEKLKSSLANRIFANEMWLVKELKNEARVDLEDKYRENLDELSRDATKNMKQESLDFIKMKLEVLSDLVNDYGSKYYAYQNPEAKEQANEIVSYMLNMKNIKPLMLEYVGVQGKLAEFYQKDPNKYLNSFVEKMITPGKGDRKVFHNAVMSAAYELKAAKLARAVLLSNKLAPLNEKLDRQVEPKENVDKEKLAKAIIKVGNLQEKTPDEIARDIEPLISDEERRYEKILESKNDSDINKSDINLINKAYNTKLDKDENFNRVNDVYETQMNRAVTHLVQNFLMSLVSGARERMQELKRMLHIRNEDRHLIRKAQQKQK